MIAFAFRDVPPAEAAVRRRGLDWAQLVLPYSGFLGITMLLAFHLLTGHRLDAVAIGFTVAMVVLVAGRQVVAMDAQRKLTARLYEAQRGLAHQVLHDALTGLPNRLLFAQRLDDAMRAGHFMLIFVDIDDFKEVNDRFGHAAGDELLRAIGDRLRRCVTDADTLARIGGDEFAILVEGEGAARDGRRPAPGGAARSIRRARIHRAGAGEHGCGALGIRRSLPDLR